MVTTQVLEQDAALRRVASFLGLQSNDYILQLYNGILRRPMDQEVLAYRPMVATRTGLFVYFFEAFTPSHAPVLKAVFVAWRLHTRGYPRSSSQLASLTITEEIILVFYSNL